MAEKKRDIKTANINGSTVAKVDDVFVGKIDPSRVNKKQDGKADDSGLITVELDRKEELENIGLRYGFDDWIDSVRINESNGRYKFDGFNSYLEIENTNLKELVLDLCTSGWAKLVNCNIEILRTHGSIGEIRLENSNIQIIDCHVTDKIEIDKSRVGNADIQLKESVNNTEIKLKQLDIRKLDIKGDDNNIRLKVEKSNIRDLFRIKCNNIENKILESYIDKLDINAKQVNSALLSGDIIKRLKLDGGEDLVVMPSWTCVEKYRYNGNNVYVLEQDEETIKFLDGEITGKNAFIIDNSECMIEAFMDEFCVDVATRSKYYWAPLENVDEDGGGNVNVKSENAIIIYLGYNVNYKCTGKSFVIDQDNYTGDATPRAELENAVGNALTNNIMGSSSEYDVAKYVYNKASSIIDNLEKVIRGKNTIDYSKGLSKDVMEAIDNLSNAVYEASKNMNNQTDDIVVINLTQYNDTDEVEDAFGVKMNGSEIIFINEKPQITYKVCTIGDLTLTNCVAKRIEIENIDSNYSVDFILKNCKAENVEVKGRARVLISNTEVDNKASLMTLSQLGYIHKSYVKNLEVKQIKDEGGEIGIQIGDSVIERLQSISQESVMLRVGNSIIDKFRIKASYIAGLDIRYGNIFICNTGELFGKEIIVRDFGQYNGSIDDEIIALANSKGYTTDNTTKTNGDIKCESKVYTINSDAGSGIKYEFSGKDTCNDITSWHRWTKGEFTGELYQTKNYYYSKLDSDDEYFDEEPNQSDIVLPNMDDLGTDLNKIAMDIFGPDMKGYQREKVTSDDFIGDVELIIKRQTKPLGDVRVVPKTGEENLDGVNDVGGFLFQKEEKLYIPQTIAYFLDACRILGKLVDNIIPGAKLDSVLYEDKRTKSIVELYDSYDITVKVDGKLIEIIRVNDETMLSDRHNRDLITFNTKESNSNYDEKFRCFEVYADMEESEQTKAKNRYALNKLIASCEVITVGATNIVILGDRYVVDEPVTGVIVDTIEVVDKINKISEILTSGIIR